MSNLEAFFTPKKQIIKAVKDANHSIEALQALYKGNKQVVLELKDEIEALKKENLELKNTIKDLVNNYQEVMDKINDIFGVEDFDPKQENKAKNERNSFSKAVNDLFDWGDSEE